MATDSAMSELDAVNRALIAVGQVPVSSLGSGTHALAEAAEIILKEAKREVQAEGWWFNTEIEKTYTPNASDEIELGDDVLAADGHAKSDNYIKRGSRLYNLADHTFTFTSEQDLDVVLCLEWDDMPLHARAYISTIIATRLAEQYDRDPAIIRTTQAREKTAREAMLQEDTRQADANVFADNAWAAAATDYGGRGAIERGL